MPSLRIQIKNSGASQISHSVTKKHPSGGAFFIFWLIYPASCSIHTTQNHTEEVKFDGKKLLITQNLISWILK